MKGGAYGCGQCLPCRINRRRVWTHRIMLEAAQYEDNSFLTLTYEDDKLPAGNSLDPRALTLFIKRLRTKTARQVRYFGCGEYGEQSGRPHYHLAMFNYPSCRRGLTQHRNPTCCDTCDLLATTWGYGQVMLGTLTPESAAYVAGYVSKKYTHAQNYEKRIAPFARMSLRPAIGLGMMHELASTLLQHKLDERMIDVPISLQHGTKKWPLGRYLRRKLRTYIGRPQNAPQAVLQQQEEELQNLRDAAWNNQASLKTEILNKSLGRRIQINARNRSKSREKI